MSQQQLRIRIEDLPDIATLTEQEQAEIFGTGRPRFHLGIESLETRELMAASLTANLSGGVLRVEGTNSADSITVVRQGDQIRINGISITAAGNALASVAASQVSSIHISAGAGDDSIWLNYTAPALLPQVEIKGGAGNDKLTGPTGAGLDAERGINTLNGAIFSGGKVFGYASDGTLWERDAASGATKQLLAQQVREFTVAGTRLIVLAADGYLRQRDVAGGKFTFADDENGTATGGYEPNVVEFGVTDGHLHLRTEAGVVKVVPLGGGAHTVYRTEVQRLERAGDTLFMEFTDGYVRQKNLDGSGWRYALYRDGYRMAPQEWAVWGDRLYALASDGVLFGRSVQTAPEETAQVPGVQGTGGRLFFRESDGYLYRFNPTAGTVDRFDSTPVKSFDVTSGYVFMLETNGNLYKQGAASGTKSLFHASPVDAFDIRADVVYFLESGTGNLFQRGASASAAESIRLNYQETNGLLFFVKGNEGTYLFNFNRVTGRVGLTNNVTRSFTVDGNYLVNLKTDDSLTVHNVSSGTDTVSETGVRSYLVAGSKVIWLGDDGYLRQRDLAGSRVSFADDDNGSARGGYEAGVVEFGVTDGYLHLRTEAGVLKVVPLGGGAHTIHETGVGSYVVAGSKVIWLADDGYLRQRDLAGSRVSFADDDNGSARGGYEAGVVEFGVSDGYLHLRTRAGVLKVVPVGGGRNTVYRGTDIKTGPVTDYAIAGGKLFMLFRDGYLRQQNLDGTGWSFANVESGKYDKVQRFEVNGNLLTYLEADNSLRVRDLVTGELKVSSESVRHFTWVDGVLHTLSVGNRLYKFTSAGQPQRLSNVGAMLVGDVLVIVGTDRVDRIVVQQNKGNISIEGVTIFGADQMLSTVSAMQLSSLEIRAWGGADVVSVAESVTLSATIYGGMGKDIIQGGGGDDVIFGEQGNDVIAGGAGADEIHGGSGDNQVVVGHLDTVFIQTPEGEEQVSGSELLNSEAAGLGLTSANSGTGMDTGTGTETGTDVEPAPPIDDDKPGKKKVKLEEAVEPQIITGHNLTSSGVEDDENAPADEPTQVAGAFLISDFNPLAPAFKGDGDSEAYSYNDIVQQGTPTCAFAAALSAVARTDYDLEGGIVYLGINAKQEYLYKVRLHVPKGKGFKEKWVTVAYDRNARFDRDLATSDEHYNKEAKAYVSRTVETGEFWTVLYQRAYLSLMEVQLTTARDGSATATCTADKKTEAWKYDFKVGRVIFEVLTGRKAYTTNLADSIEANGDIGVISALQDDLNAGRPVTAGTLDAPDEDPGRRIADSVTGLVHDHTYTIVGIHIPCAHDAEPAWVILRNPWGQDTDFGVSHNDGWKPGDTFEGQALNSQENDGLIRIRWSAFVRHFERISVGQV